MSNIIGRKEEKNELLDILNSKKAEFVVVYGRRRVGKTFLIEEFYRNQKCVFFYVIGLQDGRLKEQLEEFSKAVGNTFYKGATIAPSESWMNAFEELTKAINGLAKNKKVVLFFDELPWMATNRSKIVQALGYYWNRYWSKIKTLKLIVCGSSASWIIKNIVKNKGNLHNRATRNILLKPFQLSETKMFLHKNGINLNDKQILQLYMAIGGIPHYLDHIKKGMSAPQIINNLCFKDNGLLFSEFEKLFHSLFDEANIYMELIKVISQSREGVSRAIIEESSEAFSSGGTLSRRLNDLELAGFIKSFLPLEHQRQGIYYRIIDEYCYFYLKWIEPQKHTLLALERNNHYWLDKANTPEYYNWMGYAFEAVCYKHLSQIRQSLSIDFGAKIGTWRYVPRKNSTENGAQIDLLFERKDNAVSLCEIKCTDQPFILDKSSYNSLMNKIAVYQKITRSTKQIFVILISANGVKENSYSKKIDGVVTLDDLLSF